MTLYTRVYIQTERERERVTSIINSNNKSLIFINYFYNGAIWTIRDFAERNTSAWQKHFIYNKVRTNKDKLRSIYWECRHRLTDNCTVHIKTDQNGRILILPKTEHNHENDQQGAEEAPDLKQRPEAAPSILINEHVWLRLA